MNNQSKPKEYRRTSCCNIFKEIYREYGGWGIVILPLPMLLICIIGIWNLSIVRIYLLVIIFSIVGYGSIYTLDYFQHYTCARVVSFLLGVIFIFIFTTHSKLVIRDDSVPIWLKALFIIVVAGIYILALFFIQNQYFQIAYALFSYFYSIYFEDIVLKAKEMKQDKIIEMTYKFLNWWTQDWSKNDKTNNNPN